MSEVKRYSAQPFSPSGLMFENEFGHYVLFCEYEKLKAENAELKWFADKMNQYVLPGTTDTQDSALAAFAKLTRQRDTLKKALEFYADINNWSKSGACSRICGDSDFIQTIPNQTTQPIGGKTARKALQEAEGME